MGNCASTRRGNENDTGVRESRPSDAKHVVLVVQTTPDGAASTDDQIARPEDVAPVLLGSSTPAQVSANDTFPSDDSDLTLPPLITGGITRVPKALSSGGPLYLKTDTEVLPHGSLVIAIDFGTSRTAYSYSFMGKEEDIRVYAPVNSVLNTAVQLKAETSVVLDESRKAVGFGLKGRQDVYLQQEGRRDLHLFQWFKMNLQHVRSDNDEVMVKDHRGLDFPLLTVVTEALAYVASSALEELASLGRRYAAQDVHWVITVPAIWTPAASGFMRRAAWKANMISHQLSQNLTLVKEPEGASLLMMQLIQKRVLNVDLQVGSEVVVLDLGGGTNDMTFIRIISTSPMCCVEIKTPSGGSHGATKIDAKLEQLLEYIFTVERYRDMKAGVDTCATVIDVFDKWEATKLGFEGKNSYRLDLSALMMSCNLDVSTLQSRIASYNERSRANERIALTNRTITLPAALIRKWFNEVISGICADLYNNLMHPDCQNIRFIHLVGGFSANKYVYTRLMQFNGNQYLASRQLTMFRSNEPDFAIVRGAVLARMVNFLSHRVAKYSYGIEVCADYQSGVHDVNEKVKLERKDYVRKFQMYVKQGDYIPTDFVTEGKDFYPISASSTSVTVSLFIIDDEELSSRSIIYTSNPKVVKYAGVDVPLTIFGDRTINVSIKFGSEVQIIVKDGTGVPYRTASVVQYACSDVRV